VGRMSSEFAARMGWTESLERGEAKVLAVALQAALEVPGEALEEMGAEEDDLLDRLAEGLLDPDFPDGESWIHQMGEADREAVGTALVWLQYPEGESPALDKGQWRRLEEVSAAVAERSVSLAAHEMGTI